MLVEGHYFCMWLNSGIAKTTNLFDSYIKTNCLHILKHQTKIPQAEGLVDLHTFQSREMFESRDNPKKITTEGNVKAKRKKRKDVEEASTTQV